MRSRPLVVELVGPAGAGKSTLARALRARKTWTSTSLSLWGLPRPALVAGAGALIPIAAIAALAGRPLRAAELGQMVRLEALRRVVARARRGRATILLDEGPVFGLSWLEVFYGRNGDPGWASWRRGALAEWSVRLDAIVLVDAADEILTHRIRTRAKPHLVKHRSDRDIREFGARFRRAFDRVIGELKFASRVAVLDLRTDHDPAATCAARLDAALAEAERGA